MQCDVFPFVASPSLPRSLLDLDLASWLGSVAGSSLDRLPPKRRSAVSERWGVLFVSLSDQAGPEAFAFTDLELHPTWRFIGGTCIFPCGSAAECR